MKKRILSFLLAAVMIVSLLPMSAMAGNSLFEDKCGFNLTWSLDNGVLTISGEGDMFDYQLGNFAPWNSSVTSITSVVLPEGLTSVGNSAFLGCIKLTSIDIPEGVTSIGSSAFLTCSSLASIKLPESLKSIGKSAFFGCLSLSDIYFAGNSTKWETVVISSNGNDPLQRATMHFGSDSLEITSQPENVTADENKDVCFRVSANSSKVNYQWQYKTSDGKSWNDITEAGADTATLNLKATAERNGYQYRCVISDDIGNSVKSNPATLTVNVLEITSQPESVTAEEGEYATFSVAAKGKDLTYQWQCKTSAEGSWSTSTATGAKTSQVTVKATLARSGWQYRCIINDAGGKSMTSNAATLTVRELNISSQPKSVIAEEGQNVTFSITATGKDLTYQWQYKTATGSSWNTSTATGAKTPQVTVKATDARDGWQYRCAVTDANKKTKNSDPATLTIGIPLAITSQPESVTVEEGQNATFSVAAVGSGLSYQWEYKTKIGNIWAESISADAKTAELNVTAAELYDGRQYHCVIKDALGNKVTSDAAMLTVTPKLEIKTQPKDATLEIGEIATFKVSAKGSGLTYQWECKTPSASDWSVVSSDGADTAELNVNVSDSCSGWQYRCVVTDANGKELISNAATLTVKNLLTITAQPESVTAKVDSVVVFNVKAKGKGLTYQWQFSSVEGQWSNSTSTGTKTDELTVKATKSRDGWKYRCIITDENDVSVISTAAVLTVIPNIEITSQPKSVAAYDGDSATFSIAADGKELSYQWQYKSPTDTEWIACTSADAITSELTVKMTDSLDGCQYRCVITDVNGDILVSDAATLSFAQELVIVSQPKSVTAPVDEIVKFSVTAKGSGLSYQWYFSSVEGKWSKSTSTGAKTSELTVKVTKSRDGWQYHCVITDATTNSVISDPATLTVGVPIEITSQPKNATAQVGQYVTFSVETTGNVLSYQWQYKTPTGTDWNTCSSTGANTSELTIQATAALNGQQYRCIVTDANGAETASSAATLTIAKLAAPIVKITTVASTGKPKLTWDAVDGASKYEVYRATSKTGTYSKMFTTTNTSYTNSTAVAGKTYYYKVKAISSDITNSDFSEMHYITCDCAAPVVSISTVASTGKPKLTWDAVDGATKYEVYRATSKDGTYSKMYTTSNTSYTNSTAVAGKTYYYKVKAICGASSAGNSALSDMHYITCDCAAPVVSISTVTSTGKPKLTWDAVDGATKYEVYRATSSNGTYSKMYTTSNTNYTNTTAVAGTTYYYKVKAICGASSAGNSAYSAVVNIKSK